MLRSFYSVNYEMKKPKSIELEDRLSELPDALILHIFDFLPTIDVVRTTILSSRWKSLWTTIPRLAFFSDEIEDTDKVRDLVNGAVRFWRGVKIFEFKVSFRLKLDNSVISDLDSWVHFAKENKVEELCVDLRYHEELLYWVPQCLYSCSSLKTLLLERCNFRIDSDVHWYQLTSLTIVGVCLSEKAVSQILLGCPQLKIFILCINESDDCLSIRSSSLKELYLEKFVDDYDDQAMDTELRIWTPNLETLQLMGAPYRKCLLEDVSSLTCANLRFSGPSHHEYDSCSLNDFLGERLREIFPVVQHVENVTLSDWCIEVLGSAKEKYMVSPNPNVKFLQLNGCHEKYEQILGLLEMFPELKMLVLEGDDDDIPIRANHEPEFEINPSKSFLLQLRTIEVYWTKGDTSFFPLVECLLKYASRLEKVVFHRRMNRIACKIEVFTFCITGAADDISKILTKMRSC